MAFAKGSNNKFIFYGFQISHNGLQLGEVADFEALIFN